MEKIKPCLWFDHEGEEAARFYMSIFRNSKIVEVIRNGEDGPGPEGSVLAMTVSLDGRDVMILNGGPTYRITPAISLFVGCENQAEIDDLWSKLTSGGGAPVQCGWLTDKFGVSWQIAPTALMHMIADKDPARAKRAMQAMMQMVKLDLAALQAAYDDA
ncbi:MAG TPA: VOC family protein [Planctomycetota bacterium]|nr:VOC family protein [Planctomycetota bacterium]